jgi:hypothetical protein
MGRVTISEGGTKKMRDKFKKGRQPCDDYTPQQEMYRDNKHECFGPYGEGNEEGPRCRQIVSFCENCRKDHHADGWDNCGKILWCEKGHDIECMRDDCESCEEVLEEAGII